MGQKINKLIQRCMGVKGKRREGRRNETGGNGETLEQRTLLSVSSLWFSGNRLVVKSDNASTSVSVSQSGSNLVVSEVGTSRSWSYARSSVGDLEFQGGNGNDRFVNNISNLPTRAFGNAGNDYLEGYNAVDTFVGGAGDDTLVGYGGDDIMWGGTGNDVLRGMDGNDQLMGDDGNDRLNGGNGADKMWGGAGNDVLISIDNAVGDFNQGDAGRDTIWVDKTGSSNDGVAGATSEDAVQYVAFFANGADRTLNGDRIGDPTALAGQTYKTFSNRTLFGSNGPQANDIRQGATGDCYLLAGLSAIADDSPQAIRNRVVDFDDGTYGVRLGDKFYRVDNDLPVRSSTDTNPANAGFGANGSMWVAVVEKAFAHYRTGANSYGSIEGGWGVEANRAFGTTAAGDRDIHSYSSATALANEIFSRWNSFSAVTIGFTGKKVASATVPLVMGHMYTVMNVIRNSAGTVTSIVLRNPWGYDGAGNDSNTNDGLVSVTPSQLMQLNGRVNWGRV